MAGYKRKYGPSRSRRPYAPRRRLSAGLRTFRAARRSYPASDYGYQFVPRTDSTYSAFGPTKALANQSQRSQREQSNYYGRGGYGSKLRGMWGKLPSEIQNALIGAGAGVIGAAGDKLVGRGGYTGNYRGRGGYKTKLAKKLLPKVLGKTGELKGDGPAMEMLELVDLPENIARAGLEAVGVNVGSIEKKLSGGIKKLFGGGKSKAQKRAEDIAAAREAIAKRNADLKRKRMLASMVNFVERPPATARERYQAQTGQKFYDYSQPLKGRGGYTGAKNNLFLDSGDTYASEPRFSSRGGETGALTISHREFIKDIFGNSLSGGSPIPFVNQGFEINPGLEASFPWLSQVAQNFEEFSMKQLVYTYKPTIADVNSANGQVGSIVTATNYNPSRPDFDNKMVMMEYAHAHTTKAVDTNIHGVEAAPGKLSGSEGKYVRAGSVPSGEDIKTYDHGRFQIAVCGTPTVLADLPIGELWVEYTIELRKPKLFTGLGRGISRYTIANSTFDDATSAQKYPLGLFGAAVNYPVESASNTLDCKLMTSDATTGTVIRLPSSFTGYLELRIKVVIESDTSGGAFDWHRLQAPSLAGNIVQVNDMKHAGLKHEASEPLVDGAFIHNPPAYSASVNEDLGLTLIAHYKVQPATSGVANEFSWGVDPTTQFTGNKGNIMIWRTASGASGDWSGSVTGSALADGDIHGVTLELVEYNSPLQAENVTVPGFVAAIQGV